MKNLKNIFGLRVFKTNSFHIDLFPSENSIIEIKGISGLGKTSLLKGLMLALMPRKKYQLENSNLSTVMKLLDKYGTNGKITGNKEIDKTLGEMFCEPQKSYFGFTMNQDLNLYVIMYPKNINRLEFEKLPITILNGDSKDFFNKLNSLLEDSNGNYTQVSALEKLKQDSIIDYGNLLLSDNCDEFWTKSKKDHKLLIVPTKTKEDYESILLIMLNDIIDSNKIIETFVEMLITQEIKQYNKNQIESNKEKNTIDSKDLYEGTKSLKIAIENYKNNMIFDDEKLNTNINSISSLIINSKELIEELNIFNSSIENLKDSLNNKEDLLKELESNKDGFKTDEETKNKKLDELTKKITKDNSEKIENEKKLNTNNELIERYKEKTYNLDNLSEEIHNLDKEIKELTKEIEDIDSILKNKQTEENNLKTKTSSLEKRKQEIKEKEIKIQNKEIEIQNIENSYKNNNLLTNESKQLLSLFNVSTITKLENIDQLNNISFELMNIELFKEKLSNIIEKDSFESLSKEIIELKNEISDNINEISRIEKEIINHENKIKKLKEKSLKNTKELNMDLANIKIDFENLNKISNFYIDKDKIQESLDNNIKNIKENQSEIKLFQELKIELDKNIKINNENIDSLNKEIDELKKVINIYIENEELFLSLKIEENNLINDLEIYGLNNINLDELSKNVEILITNKNKIIILYSYIADKLCKEIDIDIDSDIYLIIENTNRLLAYFKQHKMALETIADNLDDTIVTIKNVFISILNEQNEIDKKIIKKLKKEYSEIKTIEGGKIELQTYQNDEMISIFQKIIDYLNSIEINKSLISEISKIEEFNEVFKDEKLNKFKNYKTFSENSFLDNNGKFMFLDDVKLSFDGSTGNHKIVQSALRVSLYNKYKDNDSLVLPIIIDEANGADNDLLNNFLNNILNIGYNGTICLIAANGVLQPQHITNVIHLTREKNKVYLIQEDKNFIEEV